MPYRLCNFVKLYEDESNYCCSSNMILVKCSSELYESSKNKDTTILGLLDTIPPQQSNPYYHLKLKEIY